IPARGYSDGRTVATADGLNTPTLYGLTQRTTFGWFSPEIPSLEAFVLRPLANPREMGPLTAAPLERLRADPALRAAYAAAFPDIADPISWEQTAQALAAALRSIPNPVTDYPRGMLTPAAQRGQALFAELGCGACHYGPTLSSERYINTGVSKDINRNEGKARVPSLIGLAQTAPYFHDGSAATLSDVVRAYQHGGRAPGPQVSRGISPFLLTDSELSDLVAFLLSL
ncbi:MAG: c-type cytochrome, partial [Oscillochloris sp.]|nr:c-type cytochrome [Oscillochloris sp.]